MVDDKNKEQQKNSHISSNYKKQHKKRKVKKVANTFLFLFRWILFLVIGIAAVGVYLGLTHPIFNIQYITVNGAVKNTKEKIIEAVNFQKGDNLFRIKTGESEEAVKKIPDIQSVKINRHIPNRVHITVEENYTFAYFESNNKIYTISGDGDISPDNNEGKEEIIKITGIMIEELNSTKALPKDSYIRDLNKSIVEYNLYPYIKEIDLSNPGNMKIILKDNTIVEFGNIENIFSKMGVLRKILEESNKKEVLLEKVILNNNQPPIIIPKNQKDTLNIENNSSEDRKAPEENPAANNRP
ncbi:cell division protein FtsQ/DivIB [Gallicola sp. Sow4_E12]|uniref:cell division protein FtsQ/DivIB n=1 Tax=Gallicola sp. Sow4_E12 TaxID=3438785 RepID=UPI003F8F3D37